MISVRYFISSGFTDGYEFDWMFVADKQKKKNPNKRKLYDEQLITQFMTTNANYTVSVTYLEQLKRNMPIANV